MNNILTFKDGSNIDNSLFDLCLEIYGKVYSIIFIKSLDDNITHVEYNGEYTKLTFIDEISKTFFILKYE